MPEYSKKFIFTACCMGMLIFGSIVAVIGSVLPSVIVKFDIDLADAGSLFIVMSLGMVFGSIIFGPLADRYGYKGLLIINAVLVMLSLEGIAFATSIIMLQVSLFVVGFAGGGINGGANALVSDISEDDRGSRLTLLSVFFGAGALVIPLLLGTFLDRYPYEYLIGFSGALIIIPVIFFTFLKFPPPKHDQGFPVKEGLLLLKKPLLLLFGLILFIQSGIEMTISGWSATFMIEELGIPARQSVFYLSFYWTGLIIARLTISKILHRISMGRVLKVSLLISITGSVLLLFSTGLSMALPALLLTGFGFAAVFPIIFAFVGNIYPKYSGTAFSVILTISLFGGMLMPYLAGLIAGALSLRFSFAMVAVCMLIILIIFTNVEKKINNHPLY